MLGLKRRPATDDGERIYAIGDVHGRIDLVRDMLQRLEGHDAALPPARSRHIIFLGDLVDRGPASHDVVKLLHAMTSHSGRVIVLKGNHEQMMVRALSGDLHALRFWLRVGGAETLNSFGVDPAHHEDERALLDAALDAVPAELIEWLDQLPLTARSGDYFFCHAGVRPGVKLNRQNEEDLLWIREEFLRARRSHGAVIVHGHSIGEQAELHKHRIGIDTGAYRTGVLTAIHLEDQARHLITTESPVPVPVGPI